MIESEYKRFLYDSLIQSSAGRVHNLRKIRVDIPRLIEWASGENFSKYESRLDTSCLPTGQVLKKAQRD